MRTIQDALDQFLQQLPGEIVGELVAKKFAEHGITLSKRERRSLADHLRRGKSQFAFRRWDLRWWKRKHIEIKMTPADIEQATQIANEIIERVPQFLADAMEIAAAGVLTRLRRKWNRESRAQRRDVVRFRRQHYRHWKKPLELLRMLLTICREVGEGITNDLSTSEDAPSKPNLIEVMARSHARGCQIAEEVICLLEGGFADGAMARWRSLHEVAIVASFIADHGEDLADRYVLHQAVESKRGAEEYERCAPDLGFEAMDESDRRSIQDAYAAALAKYGPQFTKGDYGWAADHLKHPKPGFKDIERAAGVGYLRSYYRMASHNVHANPKGVFFRLGVLDESQVLLAGASNAGLTDPGQCTALSLAQLSTAHATLDPTLDVCAAMKIINDLVPEIAEAFATVGREWE